MSLPPWNFLPPPTPSHPSRLSREIGLSSLIIQQIPTSYYFTYGKVYVSVLLSQFIPPAPSPTMSPSLFSMFASLLEVSVAQSCLTLCNPLDYNLQGSSVHGIFQARILEWIAIPFSRGSSRPRDWTSMSCIAGRFFTIWATRKPLCLYCWPTNRFIIPFFLYSIYIIITWCLFFSFWLTSLCITRSSFIHLTGTYAKSFLFMAK